MGFRRSSPAPNPQTYTSGVRGSWYDVNDDVDVRYQLVRANQKWMKEVGVNRPNNDILYMSGTVQDCINACDQRTNCVAISYKKGGECWLKSAWNGGTDPNECSGCLNKNVSATGDYTMYSKNGRI